MQSAELKNQKSCLVATLSRYTSAVSNMEHTIMLPSLLRDVRPEDTFAADGDNKDLYEYYLMLKSVRNVVESGLMPPDERKALSVPLETLEDLDPETLFHFHLTGLFSVLNNLTTSSHMLTRLYNEVIGLSN
ncbi:M1I1B protein, partial [Polyodon spathula]|nr:thyroid hormone-inducible hepatic protein [Polyodon spathula]MBN3285198.1 M1I1B protein [Polyodon spathula]